MILNHDNICSGPDDACKARATASEAEAMTLDVAIATHGKGGMEKVGDVLLPPQAGVRYVVSWQEHGDVPVPAEVAQRDDVSVFRLEERGVSNNRNNATRHCTADIVLAADNDLIYEPDAFCKIREAFMAHPEMDLATFRVRFATPKPYPPGGTRLSVPFPRGYWVSCVEIAFRRERLGDVCFNPMLGPGAPEMLCGEDEMFVIDAIRAGHDCRHVDTQICSHPWPSTGARVSDGILLGQGYLIKTLYPATAIPRVLLKAWRLSRQGKAPFMKAVCQLMKGAIKKV